MAVALSGCTRTNAAYCDAETPCDVGVCNVDTNACEGVFDAGSVDAATCGTSAECTVVTSPICDDGSGQCRGCDDETECLAKDPLRPICEDTGACVECVDSADCTADATEPICATGACAACGSNAECLANDAGAPVCDPSGACVECADHGDCPSNVCDLATNMCVDAANIIYVNGATGVDSGSCGAAASPCETIQRGVDRTDTTVRTVHIASGTYAEDVTVSGVAIAIVAEPGARLAPNAFDTPALVVTDGADVAIDSLAISGTRCTVPPCTIADGIACDDAVLSLFRADVSNNGSSGIDALQTACTLSVARSTVRGNDRGGIDIRDSSFDISNTFIAFNGSTDGAGSSLGGVRIRNDIGVPLPQAFVHNTVFGNKSGVAAFASGVECAGDVTAVSNIVYGGQGAASIAGSCTWTYSNVEGAALGGTNIDMDPMFVDDVNNHHLRMGSPSRNSGDPASATIEDFDGDPRPLGGRADMGADEFVE
jgi:hypothetical protein